MLSLPGYYRRWADPGLLSLSEAQCRGGQAFPGQDAAIEYDSRVPRVINTDKAPALAKAISELKAEGICPQTVEHRQVKYLNNVLEGDHGRLKRILGPKGAFKNRMSAYRTLKGMEAMHSLRKGQGTMFAYGQPNPDAVIVSRVFETA